MVAFFIFIDFNGAMNSHDSPWNTVLSPYAEHVRGTWIDQCHVVAGQTYQAPCSWDIILDAVKNHNYPHARLGYALGKWLDIAIGVDRPQGLWEMSPDLMDMKKEHYANMFVGLQEYMCKTKAVYQRRVDHDTLYPWFLWWCSHFKMNQRSDSAVWSWWTARLSKSFFPNHFWACFAKHAGLRPFDAYHLWEIRWSNQYLQHEDYLNYDGLSQVFTRLDYFVEYLRRGANTSTNCSGALEF